MSAFTPIGPPVIHNIYCSAQGPRVAKLEDDHVSSMILNNFEETGEPDEHGGRALVTVPGGANTALGVQPEDVKTPEEVANKA